MDWIILILDFAYPAAPVRTALPVRWPDGPVWPARRGIRTAD